MSDLDKQEPEAARAERDALLSALGWRAGPIGADRQVILDDAAALRPAMVNAREKQREYEGDALLWQMLCAEGHPQITPLLLTVWKQRKAAERGARGMRKALLEIRELNMSGADENGLRWANSDLIEQTIVFALVDSSTNDSGDQVQDAARLILKSYDEHADVRRFALALAFGQEAREKALCQESGSVAFLRAMLTALIDPASPDLDYLRARNQPANAAPVSSTPTGDELLKVLEDECWDLRCVNVPTGGDDYDVAWHVISHWEAEPCERIEGVGNTPRGAILTAIEGER